ncbi:arginase family protein [Corynebacterium epidermidicanis]|uniref:Deacetylase, histone deacetylase/acetoin utilization protein n=1 Tax=Corynebacterium epidermidicanis TaxID=1050174 RepID=A0A0G3GUC9_9CORY|nr:acetoin dehydrogenase [Corynebacterium epidermidicanis]AKK04110.1 deacetylase, histone deacetylase/acetoin utilization protein [Corynebacterium epidermidicanis]
MKPLLVHHEDLFGYCLGDTHPMGPDRVRLTMCLAEHFGLLNLFDIEQPAALTPGTLEKVHTPAYLAALFDGQAHPEHGIGTEDNPLNLAIPPVALQIVAATVHATRAVWNGDRQRAVNVAGGLHHAQADAMHGFCMLNDAAVAIAWLLENGAQRVAYLDLDAHHGDGVEQLFWDDPRVLTVSAHESGLYLFPGTGFAHDIGGPSAAGTAVNIALDRGTADLAWLRTIHGIIPPILERFRPEILITQHGADPHRTDPLADLDLSLDALALAYRSVRSWAERYAQGRWVALGGGGYERDTAARVWTALLGAVADVEFAPTWAMPTHWRALVRGKASRTFGDPGAAEGLRDFHPEARVEARREAPMIATSRAVFPYWGLPPYT